MNDPYIAIGSFDRQNLFYGVKSFSRSQSFLDELVTNVSKYSANAGSTIIYCTTVNDAEQVCLTVFFIDVTSIFTYLSVYPFYIY